MVTHERALAERYAERLIFLADGKLVADESNSVIGGAVRAEIAGAREARP
jgi:ABC-type polar amino acid transport system ATPase subunit